MTLKIKPFGHSKAQKKNMTDIAHFPRPGQNYPYMHQLKTNVGSLNPLLEPNRLFHIDLPFIDEQILKMTSSETLWHD